jgi:hypothetical protein
MSSDLSAYIVYGAREDELIFKDDSIEDIYYYIEDTLYSSGIRRVIGFDSEEDNFIGFVLESTDDWESRSLCLSELEVKLKEAKLVWEGILDNPEVLRLELIPSYF